MKWPKWQIALDTGDFLPVLIGIVIIVLSLPGFLLVWLKPDRNSGVIGVPLLVILGAGVLIGFGFLFFGLRICAFPGTWLYRITHGRMFSR
jgi:hypothetical protein